jgi:hypothetical protein
MKMTFTRSNLITDYFLRFGVRNIFTENVLPVTAEQDP